MSVRKRLSCDGDREITTGKENEIKMLLDSPLSGINIINGSFEEKSPLKLSGHKSKLLIGNCFFNYFFLLFSLKTHGIDVYDNQTLS